MPDMVTSFNLPFMEAIAYFQQKGFAISPDSWRDVWQEAHARAFTVARVTSMDVLKDIRSEVQKALDSGTSLAEFKKNLIPMLQRKGWWAKDGEKAEIELPDGTIRKRLQPWRLETIYRTNLQSAYSVGRYEQMKETADARPYWQYRAIMDRKTRPTHAAMNGKVFRHDDPVWREWYPPNSWNCRCYVKSLTAEDVAERKLDVDKGPVGVHPDEGWGYNVGEAGLEAWQPKLGKYRADLKQGFLQSLLDEVCPDDWADFAETPCFKRLKKRLTQTELQEMQTLVWNKAQGGVESYKKWAEEVIQSGRSEGAVHTVGNLPGKVLDKLQTQPRLALVVLDDVQLLHLYYDKIQEARLTKEEILSIPERFGVSEWFIDREDPGLLMKWVRSENQWIKIVIRMDQRIGKGIANKIITSGLVLDKNVQLDPRYEKI